ncbi:acetylcholinesterase-like [Trichoplusia ni]|uniref:Carboxylic ester hydrolase n=1 Tax=Trichoplusia ni TaxID=7111 RepID=A0A7E5VDE6_TRINI|nr:acetylcholinesterase-like [Trichoplusia ni]
MLLWTLILLSAVVSSFGDEAEWREVKTFQGTVRGRRDPEGGLYGFYSIPYATAPRGADRFKEALPGPVWLQTLDAVDKRIICWQAKTKYINVENQTMHEDCLHVNVFVPDTEEKKLPVIVIVHGGGFAIGYGNMMPIKQLVKEKKVIAVTFNYRLGVQGFLCLGTNDVPGNAGLKDQVALLKWVKKNIARFGGNPDDVTISGGSAGSISVNLLMLSNSAKGLFHKVIPESGASVSSIAVQIDPLANAKAFAKRLNFTEVDDFHALKAFYKTTPLEELMLDVISPVKDISNLFSACVERKTGSSVFLTDSPINIIKQGKYKKLPVLFGISNMEGSIYVDYFETWKNEMNEKFSKFLPIDLQFENEEEKDEIARRVKQFYFGPHPVNNQNILAYVEYFSDVLMGYPTFRTAKLQVESGNNQIYLYEYAFADESFPAVPHTDVRGAPHCGQTTAVFDGIVFVSNDESALSPAFKRMKTTMRELWHNFIVHGKPVPEGSPFPAWPAADASGNPHMSLDRVLELRGPFLDKRMQLWDDIYDKYYREPMSPPEPPPEKHTEL